MVYTGNLLKMKAELKDVVNYSIQFGNDTVSLNEIIGKKVEIEFKNEINCIHCGRTTNKSFFQGYCYPCFKTLPQTDEGVLSPEKCQAHLGISRNLEWAKEHCLIEHYVYLTITSGLKVGVTRYTQIPTRWIDQGAVKAIKLAKTPYRNLAGQIEVELKKYVADKTNWRNMLKNVYDESIDLLHEKQNIANLLPIDFQEFVESDNTVTELKYPVELYPKKITSLNLDKTPLFGGILLGIKGQYLIFENGVVFNIRKHNGYLVDLKIS